MATIAVAALLVVGLSAALDAAQQPAPARATVQDFDSALAAALSADEHGVLDSDRDGLSDTIENFVTGTNPDRHNTSGSRIPDGWLVRNELDPFDASIETRPAAVPPFSALPPSYRARWPAAYTPTIWDVYSHGRPANWSEAEQGPFQSGLDPQRWDNNEDGIADGYLLFHGLDPLDDTLADQRLGGPQGLTVREAYQAGTNPRLSDTDADGLLDRTEISGARAADGRVLPASDPRRFDSSGSGVCDGYLAAHGLDPNLPGPALGDLDVDGATTREEYNWSVARFGVKQVCSGQAGLDPSRSKSGTSDLLDGWLIRYGLNPFDSGVADRETQRSDTDVKPQRPADPADCAPAAPLALTVRREYEFSRPAEWDEATLGPWAGGTHPASVDTDGDGIGDALEQVGHCVTAVLDAVDNRSRVYRSASDPTKADSDGDGLTDVQEASPALRTGPARLTGPLDPRRRDTDFDGIPDGAEAGLANGLDPTRVDSAFDLLRDGERLSLLQARAKDGLTPQGPYGFPGDPGAPRTVLQVAETLAGWADAPGASSGARIAHLLGPGGDADGDSVPNILDKDMDGDGLLNGWEVQPSLYEFSPFGLGALQRRNATDPLNPDTDGDRLLDGWEVQHGVLEVLAGDYTTNPAKWDSNGNGRNDGAEDPDEDSIEWYRFAGPPGAAVGTREPFDFPNLAEQQYGTDPNARDSDDDGLSDGWKVFWGLVYPSLGDVGSIYPGAPGPLEIRLDVQPMLKVKQDDIVIATQSYDRFVLDAGLASEEEPQQGPGVQVTLPPPQGSRTVFRLVGTYHHRLVDAQATLTNPYLADTDGDGMDDAWEIVHAGPITDPSRLADCAQIPAPDPLKSDGSFDPDADGLSNRLEFEHGGDPLCRDTDLGGIEDGAEVSFGTPALDDPTNDVQLAAGSTLDSDCDGLSDVEELLRSKTDPRNPDTDADGLADGRTVPEQGGLPESAPCAQFLLDLGLAYSRRPDGSLNFLGERAYAGFSATNPDDTATGIPAGWLATFYLDPRSGSASDLPFYRFAIPEFWNTKVHGPWWGGANPLFDDLGALEAEPDPDQDGLVDRDGVAGYEDPFPGANGQNRFRDLVRPPSNPGPHESILYPDGLTDVGNASQPVLPRRLLAQAYLNLRSIGPDRLVHQPPAAVARLSPCISVQEDDIALVKGTGRAIAGRVHHCATNAPFAGISVEARMGDPAQVFGGAVTDAGGNFLLRINISSAGKLELPANTLAFRGRTSGTVLWTPDPSVVPVGPNLLVLRTYATPERSSRFPNAPQPPLESNKTIVSTLVSATTVIQATAPAVVLTGGTFDLDLRLMDSGGTALTHPLCVTWAGSTTRLQPDSQGRASILLEAPHALNGPRSISITSQPNALVCDALKPAQTVVALTLRNPVSIRLDDVVARADAGQQVTVGGTVLGPQGPIGGVPVSLSMMRSGSATAAATAATSPNGRFTAALGIPTTAAKGNYVLTADTSPTPTSDAAHNETLVRVRSIPVFTNVETGNLTLGETAPVAARLAEPNGLPIAGALVRFSVGATGNQSTTRTQGDMEGVTGPVATRGLVEQVLRFDGDDDHTSAERIDQRLVLAASRLHMQGATVARGGVAEVRVLLEDTEGGPVGGAPLVVQWDTDSPAVLVTDPNGVAVHVRAVPVSAPLGNVLVEAKYTGSRDKTIGPSSASAVWSVSDGLLIDAKDAVYNSTDPTPMATLLDPVEKTPLPGLPLLLYHRRSSEPVNLTTDAAGRFPLAEEADASSDPFSEELRIVFKGNDLYGAAEKIVKIVMKSSVQINASLPQTALAGRAASAWVRLVDARGMLVDDGTVRLSMDGAPLGTAAARNGTAVIEFTPPANLTPGPRTLEVFYSGSDVHAAVAETADIRLIAPTTVSVRVERGLAGETARIIAQVEQAGRPVAGTPVSLSVEGMPAGVRGHTGADGTYVFEFEQPNDAANFMVHFDGNETAGAAAASGTLEPMTVLEAIAPAARGFVGILQVLVVVLVLVGLLLLQLRRHPIAPALGRARRVLRGRGPVETRILRAYQILQDAAISAELLNAPAATPQTLREAIQPRVAAKTRPALAELVGLFEEARYGDQPMTAADRDVAVRALDALIDDFSRFNPIWRRAVGHDPIAVE